MAYSTSEIGEMDFAGVAKDGSSPVGLMPKLRALVSMFPVLEADVASSTNATAISPFIFETTNVVSFFIKKIKR